MGNIYKFAAPPEPTHRRGNTNRRSFNGRRRRNGFMAVHDADIDLIKILLIDDCEDDYILTTDLLADARGTRYEVHWESNYEAALNAVRDISPDICLLDYQLGGSTGLEILQRLRELDSDLPVIMLTGINDRSVDLAAMSQGVSDFLVKLDLRSDMLERSIRYSLQRRQVLLTLTEMAKTDPLTGLGNRAQLEETLNAQLSGARRHGRTVVLMTVDLDRFKPINDSIGAVAGDRFLKIISTRLRKAVRAEDYVARLDGDQFALVLNDVGSADNARRVANKVLQVLNEPVRVDDHRVAVSSSIGIATSDGHRDAARLIQCANAAMSEAKRHDRGSFRFYDSQVHAAAVKRADLEHDLRGATRRDELRLFYQPQIRAEDQALVGVEALLRWQHPQRGLLRPDAFIALAESSGTIVEIGNWVLDRACADFKQLQARCETLETLAINVSLRQLNASELSQAVGTALRKHRINPTCVQIELKELALMSDSPEIVQTITALGELGVRVTVDDFGTGSSSLAHLQKLPIAALKVDQSFIAGIGRDDDDETVVNATLALARGLGIDAIAEGVEDDQQAQFLAERGCPTLQGFLFGHPEPMDNFFMQATA